MEETRTLALIAIDPLGCVEHTVHNVFVAVSTVAKAQSVSLAVNIHFYVLCIVFFIFNVCGVFRSCWVISSSWHLESQWTPLANISRARLWLLSLCHIDIQNQSVSHRTKGYPDKKRFPIQESCDVMRQRLIKRTWLLV